MNRYRIEEITKRREDFRDRVYPDSKGVPTLGWGHNVRDHPISRAAADFIFNEDLDEAQRDCERNFARFWYTLPSDAQDVLMMLCFAMGMHSLLGFREMLGHIERKEWQSAGEALMDSDWARTVHFDRANELAELLRRCD